MLEVDHRHLFVTYSQGTTLTCSGQLQTGISQPWSSSICRHGVSVPHAITCGLLVTVVATPLHDAVFQGNQRHVPESRRFRPKVSRNLPESASSVPTLLPGRAYGQCIIPKAALKNTGKLRLAQHMTSSEIRIRFERAKPTSCSCGYLAPLTPTTQTQNEF